MGERLSLRIGVVAALIFSLCLIAFSERAAADTACQTGTVPITEATRGAATAAGFPTSAPCWNPNDPNAGQTAGDAKLYLQQHATHGANVSCLNSQFSEQLEKMMQAVPSNFGTVLIDSAYRDPSTQAALVAKGASKVGACGTYHNYGLAVDFNFSSKQVIQWIRANASQYGLTVIGNSATGCFSSGFCDPAHVQESGSLPPSSQCGICSSNVVGTQTAPPVSTTGVSSDSFLYTPAPGTAVPAGYCLMSTQPLIYTPCSTTSYSAPVSSAMPIAQPTQAVQPTAATTPASVPAVTPAPASTLATSTPVYNPLSNLLQAQPIPFQTTAATSALQALYVITNIGTSAGTGTGTAFSLNSDVHTIVQGQLSSRASSAPAFISSPAENPAYGQTTFTSNNFQDTAPLGSPLMQVFSAMQTALTGLLGYLTSFGATHASGN